jgi:hypothetical protein
MFETFSGVVHAYSFVDLTWCADRQSGADNEKTWSDVEQSGFNVEQTRLDVE